MIGRWGFRARLTALIAVVLILGGAVLLTVQYVLVQQLFAGGISTIMTGCVGDDLSGSCEVSIGMGNDVLLSEGVSAVATALVYRG